MTAYPIFRPELSELEQVTVRAALEFFRDAMREPPTNRHPWEYVDESLGALATEELDELLARLGDEESS